MNPIALKNLIEKFIEQNEDIYDFLKSKVFNYKQPDEVISKYVEFLKRTNFNLALGTDFANLLQLSNDKNIYEQFELDDIRKLFLSLLRIQNYNLATFVEAAYFEWNVMNNKEMATSIASEGIQNAKNKIEELQKLLDSINDDLQMALN